MSSVTLYDFLHANYIQKGDGKPSTHFRIADRNNNVSGGNYHISDEDYAHFLHLYFNRTYVNGREEYLTEKQLEVGAIVVDLDLRFPASVQTRQLSTSIIKDIISVYLRQLLDMAKFEDKDTFQCLILLKNNVNCLEDGSMTKDGLHLMFTLAAHKHFRILLRERVLDGISEVMQQIPDLTNSIQNIVDQSIADCSSCWPMYMSRKPNHQPYKLQAVVTYMYDANNNNFDAHLMEPANIKEYEVEKFSWLQARYRNHMVLQLKEDITNELQQRFGSNNNNNNNNRNNRRGGVNVGGSSLISGGGLGNFRLPTSYDEIAAIESVEQLDEIIQHFFENLSAEQYKLKEAHDYTMILPESYYGENSHDKWIKVGMALHHTDINMLYTWLRFSAQYDEFDFAIHLPDCIERWRSFDIYSKNADNNNNNGEKGGGTLSERSILYWAKQDASSEKFKAVKDNSIDHYIEMTICTAVTSAATTNSSKVSGCTDYDLANVLWQMHKHEYVCVSPKSNTWYRFHEHKWEECELGTNLRLAISKNMRDLYRHKTNNLLVETQRLITAGNNEQAEKYKLKMGKILEIIDKLGRTNDKEHIMRECRDLFYDSHFIENLDEKPHLLCFTNGVMDLKTGIFRDGLPEDCISKCTKLFYKKYDETRDFEIMTQILEFFQQLFPEESLRQYVWDHLASTLHGVSVNQTINMYLGRGENGKSALVMLMSKILGDYKSEIPMDLITGERTKVGGLAPEIVALKAVRYAVFQEPRKGQRINEGMFKQITSGLDPLTGRAPYVVKPITFFPQFKAAITTNEYLNLRGITDHGTWRRWRVVPFKVLFTDNPDPKDPFQQKKTLNIENKFDSWKGVFMALMIDTAVANQGLVQECDIVLQASEKYRISQDQVAEFVRDKIMIHMGEKLNKVEISGVFREWYMNKYHSLNRIPDIADVYDHIDRYFKNKAQTRQTNIGWPNLRWKTQADYEREDEEAEAAAVAEEAAIAALAAEQHQQRRHNNNEENEEEEEVIEEEEGAAGNGYEEDNYDDCF